MEDIKNNINCNVFEQPQRNDFQIKDNNLIIQNQLKLNEVNNKYSFELKKLELEYQFNILQELSKGKDEKIKLLAKEKRK